MNRNFFRILNDNFDKYSDNILIEEDKGKSWTYHDVKQLTFHFSSFLKKLGLKKGSKIIIQAEKTVYSVCLYLCCLKSGIIYVPLNTAYTSNEMTYFIDNIDPDLMFLSSEKLSEHKNLLTKHKKIKTLVLERDNEELIEEIYGSKKDNYIEDLDENYIASIIFTSGTTGKSKGAMITHKNLESNGKALRSIWGFSEDDILLHALPIFHVHGLFVALNTIFLSGAKIIFFEKFSPESLIKRLPEATVMMGVPTYYSRLLSKSNFNKDACESIRLFISGSAPLTEIVFKEFKERTGHKILERYGMSETGMISSNPLNGERVPGTVGFALPDVEVRVANELGEVLSSGDRGIVEVKGPNVFRGYWRLEEKTKKDFRSDGFFITGDVGQLDNDGRLTLFGRSNDMLISGGYNIYPKEIELILDEIEGINESAVIGCPHDDLGEAVVAILISTKSKNIISDDSIEEILLKSLAKFKCPARYIWLNELPRNAMGKVQKKVLKEKYKKIFKEIK